MRYVVSILDTPVYYLFHLTDLSITLYYVVAQFTTNMRFVIFQFIARYEKHLKAF